MLPVYMRARDDSSTNSVYSLAPAYIYLDDFTQKNARHRFSFSPQPPTKNDTESYSEYLNALHEFDQRNKYIEGLHVTIIIQ